MARVAIVSYDVQTIFGKAGGVGAFTTRWANLLRDAGEDVTIVMTRCDHDPMRVDTLWRARYQADNIGLIELQSPPPLATRWPEVPTMRLSEIAAPVLRGFDIVYFQDWGNTAFHLVRERLCSVEQGPVCITVLHGPSEWELMSNEKYPRLPDDLHLAYQERYGARHSDFVVSPTNYMVQHLREIGWEFPGEVEVLGLPMPESPAKEALQSIPSSSLRKIVYFGRIEERKGIRLFVQALEHLRKLISERPEVVLLGASTEEALLQYALKGIGSAGFRVSHLGSLDSERACQYLRSEALETLCVVPSRNDNHPYAVVEASLIEGLNLIVCQGGGVPEVLKTSGGRELNDQISEPYPKELAHKMAARIRHPLAACDLARYDSSAANRRWLLFHQKALDFLRDRQAKQMPANKPSIDVCLTYYQKAPYLEHLVDALENQSDKDFHVIAVNDGSPDEESNRVFEHLAETTKPKGWDFYRQENSFVDAARNSAARRGQSDLILFVDSDDVPALNAVARMREAITLSGADAVICGSFLFASEGRPFDPATGEILVPAFATCVPLGMDLVGGLLNPCVFGGSMFIVRRSVFEAIGGFREVRGAGHEDWELYVRLALRGYKVEILPELLQFYRQIEGSLSRTLSKESSKRRLLDAYEESLNSKGLNGGALALFGLYQSSQEMERKINLLSAKAQPQPGHFNFFSGATQRFEVEPHGLSMRALQNWYRHHVSFENRLKIHRIFLAPFFGPYKPPSA